jgi:hypothetical protein
MILLKLFVCFSVFSQNTLSGSIYDANSKETLVGASVYVKALKKGVITDVNGSYSISLPAGKHNVEVTG